MNRLVLLAALFTGPGLQEDAEIARQIARISEKDPDAAFDAIARLVDLDSGRVRTAAGKLPEGFYRQVLLDEVAARASLGAAFGRVVRLSVDAKDASLDAILKKLASGAGEHISCRYAFDPAAPPDSISVTATDVPYLAALQALSRAADLRVFPFGSRAGATMLLQGTGLGAEFQYRNFLVRPELISKRRQGDFGGDVAHYAVLQLEAVADGAAGVLDLDRVEILDALDDKGRAATVVPWRDDDPAPSPCVTVQSNKVFVGLPSLPPVRLLLPAPGAKKLSRVRGFVAGRAPTESWRIEIDLVKRTAASSALVEAAVDPNATLESRVALVLRPKQGTVADLLKMPMQFLLKTEDGEERLVPAYARAREGAVAVGGDAAYGDPEAVAKIVSAVLLVHRTTQERRVFFELRDVPLE